MSFVGLFAALSSLGLQNIVVRDLVQRPDDAPVTLGTTAALQLVGSLAAFALVALSINYLRPDDALARAAVIILGFGMVFNVSAISGYWFEARVQSKYVVWITTTVFVLTSAAKVALILVNAPVIAFILVTFANTAIAALCMFVVLQMRGLPLQKLQLRLRRGTELLRDSWPLLLAGLAIAVYMKIDMVMLGLMLGDEAVGIYGAAARLSEVWYFLPMTIVASVFPAILEAKKSSERLYYLRLQQLYDLMVLLAVSGAAITTFLAGWIIGSLFGAAYEPAGPVLAVHIWASVFVFLGVASGKWFIAENRQVLSLQRTAIGAVVNVGLNFLLIPEFGPIGAAWATVFSYSAAGFLLDGFQSETRPMFLMKVKSLNLFSNLRRISLATR
jgi:PST family polysaccharide transporter